MEVVTKKIESAISISLNSVVLLFCMFVVNLINFILAMLCFVPLYIFFNHNHPHNDIEKEKQKPWYTLIFELLTNTWLAGIMGFLSRRLLQYLSKHILGLNFKYKEYLNDDILTSTGFFMTYLMTLNGKYKTQIAALSEEWSSAKIGPKIKYMYENILSHFDLYNMFSK